MRTLPTAYSYTSLYQNAVLSHYPSVLAYNAAGTSSVDLTNYDSVDLVKLVTLQDSIDDAGVSGKITLQRDVYRKSISPLTTYSKWNSGSPLVFPGRRIVVTMASVPLGITPASSDYSTIADLHVDDMDFAKESVDLTCTDRIIALLRNTYIDTQRVYGSGYVAIETVMQGLIDDNINTPLGYTVGNGKKITIQLPGGSPGFLIAAPTIQKQTVLDALNQLAGNIGWSLRSIWNVSLAAFALSFYSPSRTVASPLFTFPNTVWDEISQARISKTDVRNYIYGYYTDSTNNNVRQLAIAQDATSITKYGDPPMKMELTEAATSQVNTPTQMATLLANALSDLKDPICQYQLTVPLFWPAQVSDAYKLLADNITFDTDQNVGLTAWSHTIGQNRVQTQMSLRGNLPGQYATWFAAEARPGVSPAANMLDPAAPTVLLGANVGQIVVSYTVVDQTNWSTTEVYISGSTFSQPAQLNGKNQRPTTATLAAKGKEAHFTINALTPGSTYYVAVIVIDRDGNIGTMSAVQSITTQTVGPYHENLGGQQDQLIRNPDLNIYTRGTGYEPDNWYLDPQTLLVPAGVDPWLASMVDLTNNQTGKYAVTFSYNANAVFGTNSSWYQTYVESLANQANTTLFFPTAGSAQRIGHMFMSLPFPVAGGDILSVVAFAKSSVAGSTTGIRLLLFLYACDASGTPIASAYTANRFLLTTSLAPCVMQGFALSASARTARVIAIAVMPAAGQTMTFDRIYVNRAMAQIIQSFTISSGSFNASTIGTNVTSLVYVSVDSQQNFTNIASGLGWGAHGVKYPGSYNISASIGLRNATSATANPIQVNIEVSTNSGGSWTQVASTYGSCSSTTVATYLQVAATVSLNVGDQVRFTALSTTQGGVYTTPSTYSIVQATKVDR